MQTPKKRNGSSELPKRTSPVKPHSSRRSSVTGSETSDSATPCPGLKTPANRSPIVAERRSPRSPVPERKRVSKMRDLENQIAHLKGDLVKTKDQLASSELCKKQAEDDAMETTKKLKILTGELEHARHKLQEHSESEDSHVEKLKKVCLERDRLWQTELEAAQKQSLADSIALSSAMDEIQRLKLLLETATSLQDSDNEVLTLEQDKAEEPHSLVESLKSQLKQSENTDKENQKLLNQTQQQLERANATIDTLRSDCLKSLDSYHSVVTELAESKSQTNSLKELVEKFNVSQAQNCDLVNPNAEVLKSELNSSVTETDELKSALDDAELRIQEAHIKCIMQTQTAYEAAEKISTESNIRESKLVLLLKEMETNASELKQRIFAMETEIKCKNDLNENLTAKLAELQNDKTETEFKTKINEVMAKLMDKEKELQNRLEENELLKLEMENKEAEKTKIIEAIKAEVEIARSAEQEALVRVGIVTEESDKTSRRAARVTEQLEAVQEANLDMESELKRLRVQTEQWRKAAEAAAAILTTGNNSRLMGRSGSLDADYNSIAGKLLNSPFSDDLDELPSKKKNNMLRKIGGFLKKNQK